MKYKGYVVFAGFISILTFLTLFQIRAYPFGFSERERNTVNIQAYCVSDFGDEKDQSNNIIWKARFSRFAKPSDPTKEMSPPDPNACSATYMTGKPLGLPEEINVKQKWCLGIKAQFLKKGYNWIEIYPVKSSNNIVGGDGKPNNNQEGSLYPIPLIGIIKSLDMWVWGGNYHYWLEMYVQDFRGFLHRLPAGDINFVGWKNLRTEIPGYVPQYERRVPFLKSLTLQLIKLWSYPDERVDQFYCYFDYLQAQTDVYIERFNGDDLANNKW